MSDQVISNTARAADGAAVISNYFRIGVVGEAAVYALGTQVHTPPKNNLGVSAGFRNSNTVEQGARPAWGGSTTRFGQPIAQSATHDLNIRRFTKAGVSPQAYALLNQLPAQTLRPTPAPRNVTPASRPAAQPAPVATAQKNISVALSPEELQKRNRATLNVMLGKSPSPGVTKKPVRPMPNALLDAMLGREKAPAPKAGRRPLLAYTCG